ncbi:hypothetical protein DICPUDRAFT_156282 [Dictyostelium purpureum]|uniref:Ribosome biogenesis protein NOP53 n=1 Tax=Dictyostelium purpureum TaxID=5786 RepID=F0ZW68_DICPU|nr:uncharacterized protein DICPUDRAFT_156282 [Dictyostelium purpureum]EGC31829.1 hypothetical protein DICPUDRAFT_156282 [Dictyostelium purpureum]|eukprot:XP_003291663.1 hypothetical protein DICPUDRAFT_156282 [Dictyostelium purpureum]
MVHIKNKKQRERVEQSTLFAEAKEKEIQDRLKYGAPVEEKSDDQLFYMDKSGGKNKSQFKDVPLTRAEKILAPNPNVEVLSKDVKQDNKVFNEIKKVEKKFEKIHENKKKEILQIKKITKGQRKQQREKEHKKKFELWGEEPKPAEPVDQENDFVSKNLLENRNLKAKKVNHPALIKKVLSIDLPEPGMSYNPSYNDHQDTLGVAVAKEIIAQDYIDGIDNQLNPEVVKYQDNGIVENIEFEPATNEPTDRITKKEKNKRIRRAEEMKRQKAAQEKKLFNQQIDKVLETLEEVKQEEDIQKEKREKRVEKKKQNTLPRRLGKYKINEIQEPILLTNQLPKSFSSISNDNYNPLKERYHNLQKRHVIEASGPQNKPKKAKLKVYTSNAWNNTTPASIDN